MWYWECIYSTDFAFKKYWTFVRRGQAFDTVTHVVYTNKWTCLNLFMYFDVCLVSSRMNSYIDCSVYIIYNYWKINLGLNETP